MAHLVTSVVEKYNDILENKSDPRVNDWPLMSSPLPTAWIFYEYLMSGWWGSYSFRCQPVDYSNSPMALRMANTCWWYYISKFTEFFDT
ncbi:GNS1/SUR4 family [Popillia japonica]